MPIDRLEIRGKISAQLFAQQKRCFKKKRKNTWTSKLGISARTGIGQISIIVVEGHPSNAIIDTVARVAAG
jgi:hypothetical protein